MKSPWRCLYFVLITHLLLPFAPPGQAASGQGNELADELKWLQAETVVFSAARREENLFSSSSAAYVISNEDIRNSGASSIPELLRMAPGVNVARINASQYAISIRGFNGRYAEKLLVMIDGRTVYTPTYAGVYWEIQDMVLADIERIEVIRGPGSSIWGANAVNGVINIITKSATDTAGGLVAVRAGNDQEQSLSMRYGVSSERFNMRLYAKGRHVDNMQEPFLLNGQLVHLEDKWHQGRLGGRLDWQQNNDTTISLLAEGYSTTMASQWVMVQADLPPNYQYLDIADTKQDGGNMVARIHHRFGLNNELTMQSYLDYGKLDMAIFTEERRTVDVDLHHFFELGERNLFTWGLGYRYWQDEMDDSFTFGFIPDNLSYSLYSGFVQDKLTLVKEHLYFTLGAKLEHHQYTGSELQPTARLLWTPTDSQTGWLSVSRASRTPSRINHDVQQHIYYDATPRFIEISGNDEISSERLTAYELGYRIRPSRRLELDGAIFYNDYEDLIAIGDFQGWQVVDGVEINQVLQDNSMTGSSWGGELSFTYDATNWWRLKGSYSYLNLSIHDPFFSYNPDDEAVIMSSPSNQASLLSYMTFGRLRLNGWLRYVDELASSSQVVVDSYVNMNLLLSYQLTNDINLAIVGENVFHDGQIEATSLGATIPTIIPTIWSIAISWQH